MAVASLNYLSATEERRVENHPYRDETRGQDDQFSCRYRYSCHVENEIADKVHLARCSDECVVHDNSLNLFKTRYKYVSNSNTPIGTMKLDVYGKQTKEHYKNNKIRPVLESEMASFDEKSRLTSRVFVKIEVVSC